MDDDKQSQVESNKEANGENIPEATKSSDEKGNTTSAPSEESGSTEKLQLHKDNWLKRFLRTKKGKITAIILGCVVVLGILFAVPFTRYEILGAFIKKDVKIIVVDNTTKKPVTEATIAIGGFTAKTAINGKVDIKDVPVGDYTAKVTKKHYKDDELPYSVPIFTMPEEKAVQLTATGRQVMVMVTNLITKQPLDKATLTVDGTAATTDGKGEATIVLPADKATLKGVLKRDGYNQADVEIKVTDQTDANKLTLTPGGKVYYLSKETGKINVMKANLDGTAAAVVVEATGNESDSETALLAARDWRYMVLSAKRKSDVKNQLYLIDSKSDSLKAVDEGNVSFQLIGWSDHKFFYIVTRDDKQAWEDKHQALKSYDADTGKLSVIDEAFGTGTSYETAEYETFSAPYIIEGKVLYAKGVNHGALAGALSHKAAIFAVNVQSEQVQRIKEFNLVSYASVDARLYEPQEVYYRVVADDTLAQYFEYEGGNIKSTSNDDDKFYNTTYPTFLISPSGQKTLWHESRNGKNAIFIGDKNGLNSEELAQQSEFATYGWHSDDYILVSKDKSELYVVAAKKPLEVPIKIANYHKATLSFAGYGYGYGGL
jgi:hypothetical protein